MTLSATSSGEISAPGVQLGGNENSETVAQFRMKKKRNAIPIIYIATISHRLLYCTVIICDLESIDIYRILRSLRTRNLNGASNNNKDEQKACKQSFSSSRCLDGGAQHRNSL